MKVNSQNIVHKSKILSYSKQTGLRSMQNIRGFEREIIEAYRRELTHDTWGNPQKLLEWVNKKFCELRDKNYTSDKINNEIINERNNAVKDWAELIDNNNICQNNPFLKLKVLKSIIDNIKDDNIQLPPVINRNVFDMAIYEVNKYGLSFKKTYLKLFKQFQSIPNIIIDDISENGIRGKWYSVKIPNYSTESKQPSLVKKIKEFISVLSQGSNWCTRNTKAIDYNFMNMDLHIFVDSKGYPQICIIGSDKNGGNFKYIRGNNQYSPIENKYKEILKSFLISKKLDNAVVGETDKTQIPVLNLCK